ncbi:MAG: response regulator transcription factor [Acidobacteriia bacterium]|nr:response regulator transcription factor [Terriglobia bacterium]
MFTGESRAQTDHGYVATQERWRRLKAESQRLRVDFVRSELEICYTIATFFDGSRSSEHVRDTCRLTAAKGYSTIAKLLTNPAAPEIEAHLQAKMKRLRDALKLSRPERAEAADAPFRKQANHAKSHLPTQPLDTLTEREFEVLTKIAEGHSTKEIAALLGVSFKTAACHRSRIMEKLHIHQTAKLVRYAVRHGVVKV